MITMIAKLTSYFQKDILKKRDLAVKTNVVEHSLSLRCQSGGLVCQAGLVLLNPHLLLKLSKKHIFCFLVYRRDQSLQIPTYTQYIFWFQQWLDYLTCEREVVTDMPKFSIESLFNKILFHYQVESVAESPRFVLFSERK